MSNKKTITISRLLILLVCVVSCGILIYHSYGDQAIVDPYWLDVLSYVKIELIALVAVSLIAIIILTVYGKNTAQKETETPVVQAKKEESKKKDKKKPKAPQIPDDAQLKQQKANKKQPTPEPEEDDFYDEDDFEEDIRSNPLVQNDYYASTHRDAQKQQPKATQQKKPAQSTRRTAQIPAETQSTGTANRSRQNVREEPEYEDELQDYTEPAPVVPTTSAPPSKKQSVVYDRATSEPDDKLRAYKRRAALQSLKAASATEQASVPSKPKTNKKEPQHDTYESTPISTPEPIVEDENPEDYYKELKMLLEQAPDNSRSEPEPEPEEVVQEVAQPQQKTIRETPKPKPTEKKTSDDTPPFDFDTLFDDTEPATRNEKPTDEDVQPDEFNNEDELAAEKEMEDAPGFTGDSEFSVEEAMFLDKLQTKMDNSEVPSDIYSLGKYVHGKVCIYPTKKPNRYGKYIRQWCVSTRSGIVACGEPNIVDAGKAFAKIIRTD